MATILADGLPDRSRAEWVVIWGMIQSGWTQQHAMATLLMPEYAAGEKLRQIHSRSPTAAWSRFDKQWEKARACIALNPAKDDPQEVHAALAGLTVFAEEHAQCLWAGQRTLDRLAFGYLNALASQATSLTVRCSSRQLALHLNCRQPTAAAVMRRLTAGPLVSVARPAQGRLAPAYRLTDTYPNCPLCRSDSVVRTPVGEADTESVLHTTVEAVPDVFLPSLPDRRSLGRTPALVWMTLTTQPVTRAHLAAHLGKDRTTIQRALDRLHSAGFAVPDGDGWVRTEADPEVVAQALGIPPVGQRRLDRFERDREDYQRRLAETARQRYRARRRRHVWHLEQQGVVVPALDLLPTSPLPVGQPLGVGQVGRISVWFWTAGQFQVLDGSRRRGR